MSSFPNFSSVRPGSEEAKSSSRRSPSKCAARVPASEMAAVASAASWASSGMAVMATSAPSLANARATARPIPESPPVMRAARPVRRPWPS
ncbi:hypothetical protein SA2016_0682 [Sinomonas atrocyanea]|uniref:Uncharacterized protein n=1 Tax=Sinomonas atrocyanea TaxID=37927 RepID=A0A127A143_9MICC|nr:hypothetical protein SA2016_0682 [Sinomonas atrocyanea]